MLEGEVTLLTASWCRLVVLHLLRVEDHSLSVLAKGRNGRVRVPWRPHMSGCHVPFLGTAYNTIDLSYELFIQRITCHTQPVIRVTTEGRLTR